MRSISSNNCLFFISKIRGTATLAIPAVKAFNLEVQSSTQNEVLYKPFQPHKDLASKTATLEFAKNLVCHAKNLKNRQKVAALRNLTSTVTSASLHELYTASELTQVMETLRFFDFLNEDFVLSMAPNIQKTIHTSDLCFEKRLLYCSNLLKLCKTAHIHIPPLHTDVLISLRRDFANHQLLVATKSSSISAIISNTFEGITYRSKDMNPFLSEGEEETMASVLEKNIIELCISVMMENLHKKPSLLTCSQASVILYALASLQLPEIRTSLFNLILTNLRWDKLKASELKTVCASYARMNLRNSLVPVECAMSSTAARLLPQMNSADFTVVFEVLANMKQHNFLTKAMIALPRYLDFISPSDLVKFMRVVVSNGFGFSGGGNLLGCTLGAVIMEKSNYLAKAGLLGESLELFLKLSPSPENVELVEEMVPLVGGNKKVKRKKKRKTNKIS